MRLLSAVLVLLVALFAVAKADVPRQVEASNSILCDVCDVIMVDLEGWITDDTTEDEIIEFLNDTCEYLYVDTLVGICQDLLDEFLDEILDLIEQDYPADVVCELIGLCEETPLADTNNVWCTVCELIVEMAEEWVTDETTLDEVIGWLEGICTILPSVLEGACDNFIDMKIHDLANLLLSDQPPDVVCTELGVCEEVAATNSILCDVCEVIMEDLEAWLTDDATEQDIYDFLDNICDIFPDFFTATCEGIINGYVDDIVDLVMADYPPDVVCEMIGMCGDGIPVVEANYQDDVFCTICELIVEMAEIWISSDTTLDEIVDWLDGVCDLLPSFLGRKCEKWIKQEIDELAQMLLDDYPPSEICTDLGACDGAIAASNDLFCTICDDIMEELEGWLTSDTTEEEIEEFLDQVCEILPRSLQVMCTHVINNYVDEIVQAIMNDYPPDVVCAMIGLCDEAPVPEVGRDGFMCSICKKIMKMVEDWITDDDTAEDIEDFLEDICEIFPHHLEKECKEFMEDYMDDIVEALLADYGAKLVCELIGVCAGAPEAVLMNEYQDDVFCTICELIVEMAEIWISSDTTLDEIVDWLDGVCDLLPSFLGRKCEKWIKQEIDELAQMLLDDYPPSEICTDLGACDGAIAASNDLFCTICDDIMEELEGWITDETTEEEIEEFLDQVCEILPRSLQRTCDHIINTKVEEILAALAADYPPDVVCEMIGMCDAPSVPEVGGALCPICESAVEMLEQYLTEETTEQEIEELLDMVCTLFPESMEGLCDVFINKHFESLLDALVQRYPPDVICELIGACDGAVEVAAPVVADVDPLWCTVCELVMSLIDDVVESDWTQHELEELLEDVCSLLPSFLEAECDQLVEMYEPVLIEALVDDFPPDVVCGMVGLCEA